MYLDLTLYEFCSLFLNDATVLIQLFSQKDFINRIFLGSVGLMPHASYYRKGSDIKNCCQKKKALAGVAQWI